MNTFGEEAEELGKSTQFYIIIGGGGSEQLPPTDSFELDKLPQQVIHRWKGNLMEKSIHLRCRENILISRFRPNLCYFRKVEKISKS